MFQVEVQWLDQQKSRARFALPGREEWKVEHIDALMQLLAQIREQMTPPIAEHPPRSQEVQALHDPRYWTQLHPFSGGTLMVFRHPSLGWLPFLLPSAERRRIAEFFAAQEVEWGQRGAQDHIAEQRGGERSRENA